MEWIAFAALIFVIVFQGWLIWNNQQATERERKDLLNRLMTRHYQEFVNGEVVMEHAKRPDQIYAEQEEQGIPVI